MFNQNDQQQFEVLDLLVIISFMIQVDDHDNSRTEFKYIHEKLKLIEDKLNLILERR